MACYLCTLRNDHQQKIVTISHHTKLQKIFFLVIKKEGTFLKAVLDNCDFPLILHQEQTSGWLVNVICNVKSGMVSVNFILLYYKLVCHEMSTYSCNGVTAFQKRKVTISRHWT